MDGTLKRRAGRTLLALAAVAASLGAGAQTVQIQASGDANELGAYREVVTGFKAANPGVEVDFIGVGRTRDHMARLATGFAAGNPPDLFIVNYRRFGQFASRGVLEPVGRRLAERGRFKEGDYYAPAIEAFKTDGALICMPLNISSLVVFYNVQHFKDAGLPPPSPTWTWTDFQRIAKQLTRDTNGDGKTDLYGFGWERTLVRLAPFIWQAGGEVVDNLDKPTRLLVDSPQAAEALAFIKSFHTDKLAPTLAEHKSEDYEERFARGGISMAVNSRRFVSLLRANPALDFDVAPLPRHPRTGSNVTALHSDGLCMSNVSKNKEAAYKLLEFVTGPQGSAILARTGRTVPALKAAAESKDFLDPSKKPKTSKVFLDSIATMRRVPNVATWNEIESKSDPLVEDWFFDPAPKKPLGSAIIDATQGLLGKR